MSRAWRSPEASSVIDHLIGSFHGARLEPCSRSEGGGALQARGSRSGPVQTLRGARSGACCRSAVAGKQVVWSRKKRVFRSATAGMEAAEGGP